MRGARPVRTRTRSVTRRRSLVDAGRGRLGRALRPLAHRSPTTHPLRPPPSVRRRALFSPFA
ncbi:hypothetical protein M201_gp26 [Haloarcula californiae tailed virus 2]|uniref:Uncharacterized protein n=1 Tax=Haloarcula californiae tailed virus 2 TaxID=1273747 RepID=R4TNP9_9CAUD|nr:hypothetical protein M201_gp26 [Haloarcula californiae tailed virus 2]AGM11858.1 hypothetical protein HCTV2_31 [Haloarcula californiae tailed virus 2]